MPRAAHALDVMKVDALKPRVAAYRVSDGGGLLLEVKPSGTGGGASGVERRLDDAPWHRPQGLKA